MNQANRKKKVAAATLDPKYKVFIVHIAALSVNSDNEIHPSKKVQIAYLKVDEASIKVSTKYADFADIFSPKLAAKLHKYMKINDYTIELVDN